MHTNTDYEAAVMPLRKSGIEMLTGEEVFELISDEKFLRGWDALYTQCAWGTVFQSRQFVCAWYKVNQSSYLPLLVKAEDENGLVGLLTMAIKLPDSEKRDLHDKRVRIVGAGQYEAEYQVWLAGESNSDSFITAALDQIKKRFTKCDILFRYIPSQVSLGWVHDNPRWQQDVVVEAFRRPLMDMSDPDLARIFRKSEFRNKLNRLKKLGDLKFERLTDAKRFSEILKELTIQFDFRQGAMFNKNRFRENPLKAEFLLALFEQNLLHTTILTVNGELLASIVAVKGKNWVHLGGINVHTPFYAGYYSPGFVHFMMLGQQLAQEGVSVFDLTPGGDTYKERMATRHDYVYEVTVTTNQAFRLKRFIKKQVHDGLIKSGKRPMAVELSMHKKLYLLKTKLRRAREKGLVNFTLEQIRRGWQPNNQIVFSIKPCYDKQSEGIKIQKNNLGDLLEYDSKGARLSRWEFLENAMRRFEEGDQCYTWLDDNCLLGCAWHSERKETTGALTEVREINVTGAAIVLDGLYCNPSAKNRFGSFLNSVVDAVKKDNSNLCEVCYATVDAADNDLCHIMNNSQAIVLGK